MRTSQPENNQSVNEDMALPNVSVEPTAAGASRDVDGIFDDEPMCMQMIVLVSAQAGKNGCHGFSGSWIDASARNGGISLKQTARAPRSALRRTSSGARPASHSVMIGSGIRR